MRQTLSLNGSWRFIPDLDPTYHHDTDYALPNWDRRHWALVSVPGCWNRYAERYALYEGVAWFARSFHLPSWSREALGVLRFGAVNYEAQVFVNGAFAGQHQGGYTEFTLDVSALLHAGENALVVRVDDRREHVLLPACFGWFNYGGILRDVSLEISERARLDWVGVDAAPWGRGASGHLRAEIHSLTNEPLTLRATLQEPGGHNVWAEAFTWEGETKPWAQPFTLAEAHPWSLSDPFLYTLGLTLEAADGTTLDQVSTTFGVRSVRAEGTAILLNERPVWLKGLCYIPDHPLTGFSYDETIATQDLDAIQHLGANALRFHVPLHERMLQACDRRGLAVCAEAPIYCLAPQEASGSAFSAPAYRALARQMLREMVRAAYSHPSVLLWSLGNECSVAHPEAFGFFEELATTVRALDSTRLLGYASLYGELGRIGELVDVIGVNEYWGWYDRVSARPGQDRPLAQEITSAPDGARHIQIGPLDLARLQQEVQDKAGRYHKPILFTEFGADAVPGYRAQDLALWSEDYQAYYLQRTFDVLLAAPNVCGAFPFLYQDYPDPSKYVNQFWNGMNFKGLVSYDRVPKLAYETLWKIYHTR